MVWLSQLLDWISIDLHKITLEILNISYYYRELSLLQKIILMGYPVLHRRIIVYPIRIKANFLIAASRVFQIHKELTHHLPG